MPKVNDRDIFEQRPWLNDDVQNREYLNKIVNGGGGGSVTVEAVTFTDNGTYTADAGKAWSPVTVNVASDFSMAEVTLNLTMPEGLTAETEYLSTCLLPYPDMSAESIFVNEYILAVNHIVNLPLYQNKAYFMTPGANTNYTSYSISDPSDVSLSGSVVYDEQMGLFYVTGDCTITATLVQADS